MTNDDLTLQKIAQSVLDKHQVSGRELTKLSARRGHPINYTTINGLAAGTHKARPTRKTLSALINLSDFTEAQVYEAAGLPVPLRPFAEDLPPDADQHRAVLAVVCQFATANRRMAHNGRQEQRHGTPQEGTPIRGPRGAWHQTTTTSSTCPRLRTP
ncbi:hypothetical protein H7F30_11490 [Dermacoccus sp. PAMC28757]|uniref:hypothetical protein n=1 Tax=Dermacoccus sp. PAMC28757 TaxID=2762331 RepID=UPI00164D80BF|nr:hypothetical protein [Dermacoccus sp. PAMC28757]QNK52229.1 hypothetical protein H7F30_11490 [Dermacoccus sp. PAMC28757]